MVTPEVVSSAREEHITPKTKRGKTTLRRKKKHHERGKMTTESYYESMYEDQVEAAQMDLINDLDDNFFNVANKLVKYLAESAGAFIAKKLKLYVDLLARLHSHYVSELQSHSKMSEKVIRADQKLQLALETTATSTETYKELEMSLTNAWRTADDAMHQETLLQHKLALLTSKEPARIENTIMDVEDNSHPAALRVAVFRERDRLSAELSDYQRRLEMQRHYAESLELMIQVNNESVNQFKMSAQTSQANVFKAEHSLKLAQEVIDEQATSNRKELRIYQNTKAELETFKTNQLKLMKANEALKQTNNKLFSDQFVSQKNLTRLDEKIRQLKLNEMNLNNAIRIKRVTAEKTQNQLHLMARDYKRVSNRLDTVQKRLRQSGRKVSQLNSALSLAQNNETNFRKKLTTTTAELEEMTRAREEVARNRERMRLELMQLNSTLDQLRHDIVLKRNEIQRLNIEVDKTNQKQSESQKVILNLGKENDALLKETGELQEKVEGLEDQLQSKIQSIVKLSRQLQSKQQDYLSIKKENEVLHSEKMLLHRTVDLRTQDHLNSLNLQTKTSHQIRQMTKEIGINETTIAQQSTHIEHLKAAIKLKQTDVMILESKLSEVRNELSEMKTKNEQAHHTISLDEKRMAKLSSELDEISKQKNLAGYQMIRRTDEVVILRERVNTMQVAIDRGTTLYNQRLNDIRLLKLEIGNLRMSNDCLMRAAKSTVNMRTEVVRMQRQLNHERLRVRAYTEEVQKPCRIHRWRLIRGREPHLYDLICKVQVLLRRNIKLNNLNLNLKTQVSETWRMYDALREHHKFLPDPSIKERLNAQQRINRRQARKLKAMKAELLINEIDLKARECIIDGYQETLKKSHALGRLYTFTSDSSVESNETPASVYVYGRMNCHSGGRSDEPQFSFSSKSLSSPHKGQG